MDPKHKQGPRLRGPLSCRKGRECIVLGAGAERQRTFLLSLENIRQSLDVMARKWEKKTHPIFKCALKWSVRDEKMAEQNCPLIWDWRLWMALLQHQTTRSYSGFLRCAADSQSGMELTICKSCLEERQLGTLISVSWR